MVETTSRCKCSLFKVKIHPIGVRVFCLGLDRSYWVDGVGGEGGMGCPGGHGVVYSHARNNLVINSVMMSEICFAGYNCNG